tara:strand:+ start:1341 stop:2057 length:717 start_codon:yes stop_codon:yes gene_type:complete
MTGRLNRGKQLSSKQKNWLDSLIEEGVPKPKGSRDIIERIERALDTPGTDHIHNTLRDFLGRERKGWSLSEKQAKFRDRLLDEAGDIERNGPYKPSDDKVEKLQQCVKFAKSRSEMYWSTHPGEYRAMMTVAEWLEGIRPNIDEHSVDKIINSFRVKFRELDKPYSRAGEMIWTRVRSDNPNNTTYHFETVAVPALIAGPPEIDIMGNIVYPVLADGSLHYLGKSKLMKRKPKSREAV